MSDNSFQGSAPPANEAGDPAPESGSTAAPGTENPTAPAEATEPPEPRTFTQEELDKIVAKEKAKAERAAERRLREAQQTQAVVPSEPPKPDDYETAADYIEALSDWKADQKVAQQAAQERQKTVNTTFAEREEAARDKYEDFDDVVYTDDLTITPAMAQVIKTSEVGPDVAYYLGKNPKEAERIARLDPLAQARELGKIEVKVSDTPAPVKKVSSAPDPITPVRRGTGTPGNFDPTDPRSLKMDPKDWIKARNEQVAKRQ